MNQLVKLINDSPYEIYFLVVDKNLDISLPNLKHFHQIYLPKNSTKNSGSLLSLESTKQFIKDNTPKDRLPAILPFKPSAKIEKICQNNGWLCLSNPANLNRLLEDKIKFYQLCKKEKLPIIPSFVDTFNQTNFEKYSKNKTMVIQTHFGWAGNSTYFAPNYQSIQNIIPQNTLVKYSPYLKDSLTIINNCCLTQYGLLQSPPAQQLTGIKQYTNNLFSTVGRKWPADINPQIIEKIKTTSNRFAKLLNKFHYRGYFGLDILIHHNKIFIIECNPRLTASFAFYHQLEERLRINSMLYFHLLEFLDIPYQIDISIEQKRFYQPLQGQEITPRNKKNEIINKIHEY